MKARLVTVLSILALAGGTANAGLDEGKAAYERADYATALRELQPLAEQGNAFAQGRLGSMYVAELGVVRNPGEALKCTRNHGDIRSGLRASAGGAASRQCLNECVEARAGVEPTYMDLQSSA